MPERSVLGRSRRRLRSVAGWCAVSVLSAAAFSGHAAPSPCGPAATVRVVQMNLCNSGIAACYTGRSIAEGAAVLRAERPDVVTLNEICRDDLPALQAALAGAEPGSLVRTAFEAAAEPVTDQPVRCRNGQPFGVGLLTRVRVPDRGSTRSAARFPMQDPDDLEQRV